jgi:hypothetical protein
MKKGLATSLLIFTAISCFASGHIMELSEREEYILLFALGFAVLTIIVNLVAIFSSIKPHVSIAKGTLIASIIMNSVWLAYLIFLNHKITHTDYLYDRNSSSNIQTFAVFVAVIILLDTILFFMVKRKR